VIQLAFVCNLLSGRSRFSDAKDNQTKANGARSVFVANRHKRTLSVTIVTSKVENLVSGQSELRKMKPIF
jgi:hypothetical protein